MLVAHRRWSLIVGLLALGVTAGPSPASLAQDDPFYDETYVAQIELVFSTDNWLNRLRRNYNNGNQEYLRASMFVDGVEYKRVGVQHKGDASYKGEIRESLKITMDVFIEGQELEGFDILSLDVGRQSSVFNEVVSLWILQEVVDVPQANLAHVSLGTVDDQHDIGVLTSTERVDGRFLKRRLGAKGHRYGAVSCRPFIYLGTQDSDYHGCYILQGGDPSTAFQDLARASIELENAGSDRLREDLSPFINLDAAMRVVIGNRMVQNWDGFERGNNFYLAEEILHGSRITSIPWDLDQALTSFPGIADPIPDASDWASPLTKVFLVEQERERAYSFARDIYERSFKRRSLIGNRLWALKDRVLDDILGSPYDLLTEGNVDGKIYEILNAIIEMRDLIQSKPEYLRQRLGVDDVQHSPQSPTLADDVWVSARVESPTTGSRDVYLWSRASTGPFLSQPMYDDGVHGDQAAGDGVFGAQLLLDAAGEFARYYVEVRPSDTATYHYAYSPETTEYRAHEFYVRLDAPQGPIRVNELLADNENGDRDEAGDQDDWIELLNTDIVAHDLSDFALSDNRRDRDEWVFPAGTTIPAGGFLRVWADDEEGEGALHASFRLASDGDDLLLRGPGAAGRPLLDEWNWGPQEEDRSLGRVPDGGPHRLFVWDPTGEAPLLVPGAWNRYDARRTGSERDFRLRLDGELKVGSTMGFELRGGQPGGFAFLWVSLGPDEVDAGEQGFLVIDLLGAIRFSVPLNAFGDADLVVVVPPSVGGLTFYAQALNLDFSNAVIATIHP